MAERAQKTRVDLRTILREWSRIGATGFGGPPVHISMLRELCVERRGWLTARRFERGVAMANLLPGPASTQVAIYCAWVVRGTPGALAGAAGFIVPGLVMILALTTVFLAASPPQPILAAGAGAACALPAIAAGAGFDLALPAVRRVGGARRVRTVAYVVAGGLAAATVGPYLVLVLLGCGLIELSLSAGLGSGPLGIIGAVPMAGGAGALAWTALKVGGLSFGGGFVIVPLLQTDAVHVHHWLTAQQFSNGVALGQITPGPVMLTVAVVGYGAGGFAGALLACAVAFSPSIAFILALAPKVERIVADARVNGFLEGAAPAAAGAILGATLPLALALQHTWQFVLVGVSAGAVFALRRRPLHVLLACAAAGLGLVGLGAAP